MAVAFRASATSTGASITIPAGAQAGDLAILLQQSSDATTVAEVFPSGWLTTGLTGNFNTGENGTPVTRWNACWKVLVAGDPGASVTGMDGGTADAKIMVVFSGANGLSAINVLGEVGASSNTAPASQTILAASGTAPLVVIGLAGTNDAVSTFSTASPAFDAQLTAGNLRIGYKVYTSSPSNHSIAKNDEGQRNRIAGFYVTVRESQPLTPSLYSSSATFYGPTVAQAAQDLTPSLFTAAQTFYAPTVGRGAVALTPGLFTASQTFYAATVGRGAVSLTAGLYSSTATFYAPAVTTVRALSAALFTATQAFYAPTVDRGAVALAAGLYSSAATFYGPAVAATYDLAPGLFNAAASHGHVYPHTVTPGAVDLAADRFDQGAIFYSTEVVAAAVLAPARFDGTQVFYDPAVEPGAVALAADRYDAATTFYDPTVSAGGALLPSLFTDEDVFYLPTVGAGAVDLAAERFDDDDVFYGPDVGPVPWPVAPGFFANEPEFFAHTVSAASTQDIAPPLFLDADVFYEAAVGQGFSTPESRRIVLDSRSRTVPVSDLSRVAVLGSRGRVQIARPL